MPVYTVLEPRHRGGNIAERADRIVFLRDGFSWSAFVFAPLWLAYRRLWLALLVYLAIVVAVALGTWSAGIGSGGQFLIAAMIGWLVGMEAGNLRRWTMTRHGWQEVGTVVAGDRDEAEQRFFDAWVAGDVAVPTPRAPQPESFIRPPARRAVVGLFPEPGGQR